jgi:hypothetical protein
MNGDIPRYLWDYLSLSTKIQFRDQFETLLIGVEGAQTPAGAAGQVRPRKSKATRRLSASPAESEAPGTEINRPVLLPKQNTKM